MRGADAGRTPPRIIRPLRLGLQLGHMSVLRDPKVDAAFRAELAQCEQDLALLKSEVATARAAREKDAAQRKACAEAAARAREEAPSSPTAAPPPPALAPTPPLWPVRPCRSFSRGFGGESGGRSAPRSDGQALPGARPRRSLKSRANDQDSAVAAAATACAQRRAAASAQDATAHAAAVAEAAAARKRFEDAAKGLQAAEAARAAVAATAAAETANAAAEAKAAAERREQAADRIRKDRDARYAAAGARAKALREERAAVAAAVMAELKANEVPTCSGAAVGAHTAITLKEQCQEQQQSFIPWPCCSAHTCFA